jgi:hypothetical protein
MFFPLLYSILLYHLDIFKKMFFFVVLAVCIPDADFFFDFVHQTTEWARKNAAAAPPSTTAVSTLSAWSPQPQQPPAAGVVPYQV